MARRQDGVREKGDHVPCAAEESRNTLAVTGGQEEAWSTAHAERTEKRECAAEGKVQSVTNFPVHCSNRGSAGPSEKVATPATECEIGLLEGRRIIINELKTKARARENVGDENR